MWRLWRFGLVFLWFDLVFLWFGLAFIRCGRVFVCVTVSVSIAVSVVALRLAALSGGFAQVLEQGRDFEIEACGEVVPIADFEGLEWQAANRIDRGYSAPLRWVVLLLVIGLEGIVLVQPRDQAQRKAEVGRLSAPDFAPKAPLVGDEFFPQVPVDLEVVVGR